MQWPCTGEQDPGGTILNAYRFSLKVSARGSGRSLYQLNAGAMTMRSALASKRGRLFHSTAAWVNELTGPARDTYTGTLDYKVTAVRLSLPPSQG